MDKWLVNYPKEYCVSSADIHSKRYSLAIRHPLVTLKMTNIKVIPPISSLTDDMFVNHSILSWHCDPSVTWDPLKKLTVTDTITSPEGEYIRSPEGGCSKILLQSKSVIVDFVDPQSKLHITMKLHGHDAACVQTFHYITLGGWSCDMCGFDSHDEL